MFGGDRHADPCPCARERFDLCACALDSGNGNVDGIVICPVDESAVCPDEHQVETAARGGQKILAALPRHNGRPIRIGRVHGKKAWLVACRTN